MWIRFRFRALGDVLGVVEAKPIYNVRNADIAAIASLAESLIPLLALII